MRELEKFNINKVVASDKKDGHTVGLLLGGIPFVLGGMFSFILPFVLQLESLGLKVFLFVFGLAFIAGGIYVFCWGVFEYKYFKNLFASGSSYECIITGSSKGYVTDGEDGGEYLYCLFYTFCLSGIKLSRKTPYCFRKRQIKKLEQKQSFCIRYSKERDEAIYFRP